MKNKLLTIALSAFVFFPAHANFEPMLDETAMDLKADPCEDFEQYACGGWNAKTIIPEDKSSWYRSFTSIHEENLKINREILENFAKGKNLDLATNSKKLGKFYAACINTTSIADQTRRFLDHEFISLEHLDEDNLSAYIGELQRDGISVFLSFDSTQDFQDSAKMIANLDQGGLGLPSRDYYFAENQSHVRDKYVRHIAKMLELSNMNETDAADSAKAIMQFETALAEHALRPVEQRDPKNVYHMQSIAELQLYTPRLQWAAMFKTMGTPKFHRLNVAVPEFFEHLSVLLSKTSMDVIKAYLRWQIISAYSMDLGGEFAEEHFYFYERVLTGQKVMKPRWQYCVQATDNSLADALGEAFVAKTFGKDGKIKAMEILNSIQKVYENNLNEMSWMDKTTRIYAISKLNAIMKKIGYPNKWRNLSKLKISKMHMENVKATNEFERNWQLAKIGKPVDRTEWLMTPSTVNAYYNPSNNEIVFPAGILQSPIFNRSSPDAANYGAFGAVIGHEITHGFDDQGRQFDLHGDLNDWWTPGIDKIFDKKAECLVKQYSQYTVADNVHLDGKLTLGENIADLGGVKMALAALDASFPTSMSEIERITEEKKFFTAFAQVWCAKSTPELEKLRATTDPHSPAKFRINGVLTNTPDFAKAFNCKQGKPLAPASHCAVW